MRTASLTRLVRGLPPGDPLEEEHRSDVVGWLRSTDDVYRRVPPKIPPKHLVAYVLLHDPAEDAVLLVEHRRSGLWLPAGGHAEVGEDPATTARREAWEELRFTPAAEAPDPFFLTVTTTVGPPADRHVDVSLWYRFACRAGWSPVVEEREMVSARWWTSDEVAAADAALVEPHLGRALAKLRVLEQA